MKEVQIFSPKFIDRVGADEYPLADILADAQCWYLKQLDLENLNGLELTEGKTRRLAMAAARRTLRNWTEFSEAEIVAAAYDENRDQKLPEILRAIGILAQKWLANDLVPPPVTVKEISRRTGFSPQRITGIISDFTPLIDGLGKKYRLELSDDGKKPPIKRAIKEARYESRPPGGGPVQRTRFQKRRLSAQLQRLAQELTKIEFFPVDSQPEFPKNGPGRILNLRKSTEPVVDPDIAEVIQYFKEKGGKKWLRGTNEVQFARMLQELSEGRETDVLIWNCFDFDWEQKKPGEYPSCIINDDVDTSILDYHIERVRESVEYLSLLGPVFPIVLIPSNEANAPVWKYIQTQAEREAVVNSVVNKLRQKINGRMGVKIEVMRWDEYLASRGVNKSPAEYSRAGTDLIDRQISKNRKGAMIRDDQAYFEQFGLTVSRRESEKRVFYYCGVYVGEGMAGADVVKLGRNLILFDIEEFRVGEMTALGSKGTFPIVSPLSPAEKLAYYQWKKELIKNRK